MSFPMTAASKRNRRRYILPGHWVLVTSRTINGRFWFSELDEADNALVFGLLIVAMLRYGVECAGFVMLSNHTHLLLRTHRSGKRISLAMQYFLAGVARLVHAKHGTSGPVWQRAFTAVNLLDHEAQRNRLAYICEHGVKEQIVSHPRDLPLPNTIEALLGDRTIRGVFPDRADPSVLRPVEARLTPIDGWHKTSTAYTAYCAQLVDDIVAGAVPGLAPEHMRRDHAHVPPRSPRTVLRIFRADGDTAESLRAEAYAARNRAVDAAIAAAGLLMRHGIDAAGELPEGCQWPPFVSEALDEPIAEMPFEAVYAREPAAA